MSSSPIVKKPKQSVEFPPKNHLRPYRVRNNDNWWSLQKAFGLRDPWDLIRYNFNTSDPAEVNWYLREYLGCTKTTADGKNYCFSNNLKPGLLYLPRIGYKRSMAVGSGGSTTTSSATTDDVAVRKTVRWALSQHRLLKAVNFELAGHQVTHHDYVRVLRLINEGEIWVGHDSTVGDNAYYQNTVDSLYLGNANMPVEDSAYIVIHEATHAAFDARGKPINDVLSEAIAYVACMMFENVRVKKFMPSHAGHPETTNIYLAAYRIAKVLHRKNVDPDHYTVADSVKVLTDFQILLDRLMAHSEYKKQFKEASELYDGNTNNDGIRGWTYEWVE